MMNRMTLVIALTLAPAAFAQSYIVAEGDCGAVTLHLTRAADFPNLGERISADRVACAYVFVPKRRIAVTPEGGDFVANVPKDAVVMAGVDLTPTVSGNETRTEHAKALLFCGPITPQFDWQRSVGIGLEIYPQDWNGPRPTLKPGDKMRFIAVDKATGKLLRDLPMELYRAGEGRIADGVPARYGMNFPYGTPGRYMVTTTYRRPDPQLPEHWLVDTSTLTFDIK